MKHLLVVLLVCSTLVAADGSDYNLDVRVNTSRMVLEREGGVHFQKVIAVIDGKNYELESIEVSQCAADARRLQGANCQRPSFRRLRRVAYLRVPAS